MTPLYSHILLNCGNISYKALETLLLELDYQNIAVYLKIKFKDPRSIEELANIVAEELDK